MRQAHIHPSLPPALQSCCHWLKYPNDRVSDTRPEGRLGAPTVITVDPFHWINSCDLRITCISTTVFGVSWREFLKPVHCWLVVMLAALLGPPLGVIIRLSSAEWNKKGNEVPHANPVCSDRRVSLCPDHIEIFHPKCLICSSYQVLA
jgi:hypothetical protein